MKSAAFNLAFKVHRNEITFADGLLKSVEAEAQEDFIEALNSLAGETRYNVDQLEVLIEQARQSVMQPLSPKFDTQAIQEEIRSFSKQRSEIEESIRTFESQKASMVPSIIPGVNSVLLGMVGAVFSVVILLVTSMLPFLLAVTITAIVAVVLLMQDLAALTKQKENIDRRKQKINQEIAQLDAVIEQIDQNIAEKQSLIQTLVPGGLMLEDPSLSPDESF